jgi:hypothetical protein
MTKSPFIVVAMGILAACANAGNGTKAARMALACQTTDCACVSESKSLLRKDRTTDVLWQKNGDAYCPTGFALEKVVEK